MPMSNDFSPSPLKAVDEPCALTVAVRSLAVCTAADHALIHRRRRRRLDVAAAAFLEVGDEQGRCQLGTDRVRPPEPQDGLAGDGRRRVRPGRRIGRWWPAQKMESFGPNRRWCSSSHAGQHHRRPDPAMRARRTRGWHCAEKNCSPASVSGRSGSCRIRGRRSLAPPWQRSPRACPRDCSCRC